MKRQLEVLLLPRPRVVRVGLFWPPVLCDAQVRPRGGDWTLSEEARQTQGEGKGKGEKRGKY